MIRNTVGGLLPYTDYTKTKLKSPQPHIAVCGRFYPSALIFKSQIQLMCEKGACCCAHHSSNLIHNSLLCPTPLPSALCWVLNRLGIVHNRPLYFLDSQNKHIGALRSWGSDPVRHIIKPSTAHWDYGWNYREVKVSHEM